MKKMLYDNELENVNGGTWKESKELLEATRWSVDYEDLEKYLLEKGIYCQLNKNDDKCNKYVDINTRKQLTHKEGLGFN